MKKKGEKKYTNMVLLMHSVLEINTCQSEQETIIIPTSAIVRLC